MNLIGFGIMCLGMLLCALTQSGLGLLPLGIGFVLFITFTSNRIFLDYVIASDNSAIIRKRHYLLLLPLVIASKIFTLGQGKLEIVYKEEYFKVPNFDAVKFNEAQEVENPEEILGMIKISRKEYMALRNEQRRIYSTQWLNKEFMQSTYTLEGIGLKRKKRRLIIAGFFAALCLLMIASPPDGIFMALIYEALFVPMIILWIPEYKDAKILHEAYVRSTQINNKM